MNSDGLVDFPFVTESGPGTISRERRQRYAEELTALCGLRDASLQRAFATVPREAFLPPGPWLIEAADGSCYASDDDNPERILHGVGVVIDPLRSLHNATPSGAGRALQAAEIRPGQTVLHVGAGLGYYSAILAELVGPKGHVIAAEIDPALEGQARLNLADRPNVAVVGDALGIALPDLDVVFASCGLATIPRPWIAALRPHGRMLLPMTGSRDGGMLFSIRRIGNTRRLHAHPMSYVRFYPCIGLRGEGDIAALDAALTDGRSPAVQSLRLDFHPHGDTCWLHDEGWCLSLLNPTPLSSL